MTLNPPALPPEITVLERGWLSANNIFFDGPGGAALVDSGYCSHAAQTVALVEASLQGRPLALLANTHLHSDHCGGNAALQQRWPQLRTLIPPGQLQQVRQWDPVALSYVPTGQECPPFREPQARLLIAGDALWENGFGVVFPEIEGDGAFAEVGATLDLIEQLAPLTVIPGHGSVFGDVPGALQRARSRLAGFEADPRKHGRYAAKVLLKYKLLEWQSLPLAQALAWLHATPYFGALHQRYFAQSGVREWAAALVDELVASGAARLEDGQLINA